MIKLEKYVRDKTERLKNTLYKKREHSNDQRTLHVTKVIRNGFFIEEPFPMIDIYSAKKVVLSALKQANISYKRVTDNQHSKYYLIHIKKDDYLIELRLSDHSRKNWHISFSPFKIRGGFLISIEIHTFEALKRFVEELPHIAKEYIN